MRALIRCDASLEIGSGHVMRCRNLGRALRQRGAEVLFLCRENPHDLIALLSKEFRVLRLAALSSYVPCLESQGRNDRYTSWLGCSQLEDVKDCWKEIKENVSGQIDWVVVDHYGLDQTWERRMCDLLRKEQGEAPRLLVLDDLGDRPHQADVLVDASRLNTAGYKIYESQVPSTCRVLLGPAYALLDPLYAHLQPIAPKRCSLQRVLVFFGGIDKSNLTAVALEALGHPECADVAVDVVLGTRALHHANIAELASKRPSTQLHSGLPSLAGLMLRADLSIGAAGTACWERAALALPTLLTPVADNQLQGAQALANAGAAQLIDMQQAHEPAMLIVEAIRALRKQPERLRMLSAAASKIGDGRGLARVVTSVLGPKLKLKLRPATFEDEDLYLTWANDPAVRRQSFNTERITVGEHKTWFRNKLGCMDTLLWVLVDADDLPLGQIRFQRSSNKQCQALVGFSLDPVARGFGIAPELLQLGLTEVGKKWGAQIDAYAEVRMDNTASIRALQRAGFVEATPPRIAVRCFRRSVSRDF